MKKSIALPAFLLLLSSLAVTALCLDGRADSPSRPMVVHVFAALADNKYQGIVPVPSRLGNGQDPANNLYRGAAFGVKTFIKKSAEWKTLSCAPGRSPAILERCVFRRSNPDGYLVADAYDGAQICEAIQDFLKVAAGHAHQTAATGSKETASTFDDARIETEKNVTRLFASGV